MSVHIPVLMDKVINGLDIQNGDIVIDGTINGGGHAFAISQHLSSTGTLVGIDQDSTGLVVSEERLSNVAPKIHLVNDNTRNIDSILDDLGIETYNKLLLDLGWSSNQFENPERGFSFMYDGPLTMTLSDDPATASFRAYDIINDWSEESLIDILEGYGEEKYAWKITQAILEHRKEKPIERTIELAEIISDSVPAKYRNGPIHPATKTFQALRIAVNDEMGALREIMEKGFNRMSVGGRMVIISFHSIEDRIVKHYFKKLHIEGKGEILTKKPLIASKEELKENRRARSAKLRIIKKL